MLYTFKKDINPKELDDFLWDKKINLFAIIYESKPFNKKKKYESLCDSLLSQGIEHGISNEKYSMTNEELNLYSILDYCTLKNVPLYFSDKKSKK